MQLSQLPLRIIQAFADAGSKNTIPAASQIGVVDGRASLNDGFPPLTMTPLTSGGVPPSGLDVNGILNMVSAWNRWQSAGGGVPYNSAFAADAKVGGYPKGARVLRSDGTGYWLNQADNNTTDPDAGGAGWVPDVNYGMATVSATGGTVTLTAAQYAKNIINITGTLTSNAQIVFPAIVGEWVVVNNTSGAFTLTCKTASGAGTDAPPSTPTLVYCDSTSVYPAHPVAGRLIGVRVYTTANNGQTHTPTPGMSFSIVDVQAPGGGTGGAPATGSSYSGSAGSSSGAYAKCKLTAAQIGSGQILTIPAGGAAGAAGSTTGGNGSTASFGSLISCPGGKGTSSYGPTAIAVNITSGALAAGTPSVSGTVIAMSSGNVGGAAIGTIGGGVMGGAPGASICGDYGVGAYGAAIGSSSSAIAGNAGGAALITVLEFA
jgi:hypothetical protein